MLLHPTSLPGPHGHGDLGPEAHAFVRLLGAARQRWWQMLPIGLPGRGDSPYDAASSFAGSPWLISLALLVRDGLLPAEALAAPGPLVRAKLAEHAEARAFRLPRLRAAWAALRGQPRSPLARELTHFVERERSWLATDSLFAALTHHHRTRTWTKWEPALARRDPSALARLEPRLRDEQRFFEFVQWAFDRQWRSLRVACREAGVGLVGDVPMFVAHESSDVWAHRELFRLGRSGEASEVTGVPPDQFTRRGQRWGTPQYDWSAHAAEGFAWWRARLGVASSRFDVVRLDHFIGFVRAYCIAASARDARRGRFRPVPGAALLQGVQASLGALPFVAEDLGVVTPEVRALRDRFGLPGMRVLVFGFEGAPNEHLPHRWPEHSLGCTGTHDTETLGGWLRRLAAGGPEARRARSRALDYAGTSPTPEWALVRSALASPANTVILPLQDALELGAAARMNVPGTPRGNWRWRVPPGEPAPARVERLGALVEATDRQPSATPPLTKSIRRVNRRP
ncbi:MAG: 4-alpha-glucanotransferase [Polyangiaceae bacterium]|nr:4-alpha-glucanotransferase [Polyangiaceae bacterium]